MPCNSDPCSASFNSSTSSSIDTQLLVAAILPKSSSTHRPHGNSTTATPQSIVNSTTANVYTPVNNEVSWATIFWALVPIALNSMTQPVGSLSPTMSSEESLYFRASPVVCLTDSIITIIELLYETIVTKSPIMAARLISERRCPESDVPSSTLHDLQENSLFRVLVFVFGAFPQAIKLYACSGIPLSKALASMYLGSFVVLELLIITPGESPWRGESVEGHTGHLPTGDTYWIVAHAHRAVIYLSSVLLVSYVLALVGRSSPCPYALVGPFVGLLIPMSIFQYTIKVQHHTIIPHTWVLILNVLYCFVMSLGAIFLVSKLECINENIDHSSVPILSLKNYLSILYFYMGSLYFLLL